jgi:hypothetical protein
VQPTVKNHHSGSRRDDRKVAEPFCTPAKQGTASGGKPVRFHVACRRAHRSPWAGKPAGSSPGRPGHGIVRSSLGTAGSRHRSRAIPGRESAPEAGSCTYPASRVVCAESEADSAVADSAGSAVACSPCSSREGVVNVLGRLTDRRHPELSGCIAAPGRADIQRVHPANLSYARHAEDPDNSAVILHTGLTAVFSGPRQSTRRT